MTVTAETEAFDLQPDSFIRWFRGDNNPSRNAWKAFEKEYDEEKYAKALEPHFVEEKLPAVARRLGIVLSDGEEVKRYRLALAISRQMTLFSPLRKGQDAEDVIGSTYSLCDIKMDFSAYIRKASERYNVMKLLGGDEVPLKKYFVYNTIGEKQRVFTDKGKAKCACLEHATLDDIRNIYSKRRYDNRKTILIGSGGSGKTLMMQKLFLDAAEKYPDTGMMPIFLELRYFLNSQTIRSYIVETVSAKDESFTEQIADQLLRNNKCYILMDGLDEIDPSDINDFQKKLNRFTDKYADVQIVIASRECDAINGLTGYVKLYVWPFDNKQAEKLIDNILADQGKPEAKEQIMKYMTSGFIHKNGAFASHPMLLTFVAMNYPQYESFYGDHLLFYKEAYNALLSGHDDNKKPYDRVFHSVDDAEQFSTVFREFCGETYRQGVLKFNTATFDQHFSELTSYQNFKNPYKMNARSLRHDACATACMMYEQEHDIWYIDPGFQEFLFAEYYAQQPTDKVRELGESMKRISLSTYQKLDAFEMLYSFSADKVKVCIFLPFLSSIFEGKSDKAAFTSFLMEGYESVSYTVLDELMISEYEKMPAVFLDGQGFSTINEPRTVTLSYMLKLLKEPQTFRHTTKDSRAIQDEFSRYVLVGEYVNADEENESLYLRRSNQDNIEDIERLEDARSLIRGEDDKIVCFGHEYQIDPLDLEEEPEKFAGVVETMMQDECNAYKTFLRLKNYYKALRREQRRNGFS